MSDRSALILGGTGFIGPHLISVLHQRGHAVTLFDREPPQSAPGEVEGFVGDRNVEIDALKNRDWDVVIDSSGFFPRSVRVSVETLRGHVGHYIFLSTVCAYGSFTIPGIDENHELASGPEHRESYGGRKVLCERIVEEAYGAQATILRPTYVVGPGDQSDRFAYWPVRVARGGQMLVPGTPADCIQFIDVRDLADFVCLCAERSIGGTYNVCTPPGAVTMGALLETSQRLTASDARFVWAGTALDSLPENHVMGGGGELAIWAPRGHPYEGWSLISSARAVAEGLRFRDLEVTVRDTLAWHNERPVERQQQLRAGMTAQREVQLLRELGPP